MTCLGAFSFSSFVVLQHVLSRANSDFIFIITIWDLTIYGFVIVCTKIIITTSVGQTQKTGHIRSSFTWNECPLIEQNPILKPSITEKSYLYDSILLWIFTSPIFLCYSGHYRNI